MFSSRSSASIMLVALEAAFGLASDPCCNRFPSPPLATSLPSVAWRGFHLHKGTTDDDAIVMRAPKQKSAARNVPDGRSSFERKWSSRSSRRDSYGQPGIVGQVHLRREQQANRSTALNQN
jgi:hypothetical protein